MNKLKGLAYLIAVFFIILFFTTNGIKKKRNEKLIKEKTELNVKNDLLKKENKILDDMINYRDSIELVKQVKFDSIKKQESKFKNEISYWKNEYDNISDELTKISDDSSYHFLQHKFNYPGVLKFPFNSLQVKEFHKIYLENINDKIQLNLYTKSLLSCQEKSIILSDMKKDIEEKYNYKVTQFDNLQEVNINTEKKVKLLEKQLRQESKWFTGFGIGPSLNVTYINDKITPIIGIGVHYNLYKW